MHQALVKSICKGLHQQKPYGSFSPRTWSQTAPFDGPRIEADSTVLMHVSPLPPRLPIITAVMHVDIKNKAHSIMQSYWIKTDMECLKEKYTEMLNKPVQIQSEDGHHSAFTKSDVKWCQKQKEEKTPSIFQRGQAACGGLDYEGRVGGRCCKEWWDGNSFTAGRPQGSTFSTGTLSWKRERGSC